MDGTTTLNIASRSIREISLHSRRVVQSYVAQVGECNNDVVIFKAIHFGYPRRIQLKQTTVGKVDLLDKCVMIHKNNGESLTMTHQSW